MNPQVIAMLALTALRQIAVLTKTTKDDLIADVAERMLGVLAQGKMPVWTAIFWALDIARFFAARSAKTGDDKLVQEFTAVAAALEAVAGKEVYRRQYADMQLVVDWPLLAAPGVPIASPKDS